MKTNELNLHFWLALKQVAIDLVLALIIQKRAKIEKR